MSIAESLMADCEVLKGKADLPDTCDVGAATRLLAKVTQAWEQRP